MKTQQCPSQDLLRQFDLGMLAGKQFDEISHHLDECTECCDTLSGMDDQTDAVMRGLRERVPSQLVESDPELHELIAKANSLRDSTVTEDTLPTDKPKKDADHLPQLEPAQEPDEIGRLGDYRILQCLGKGGMGVVFKAEDINLKRMVALKVMKSNVSAESASRVRFLREAQAAAAITHDNIVTIHQVGEAGETPFLAMQLLEGESLAARLKREGKLPLDEVLRIGREIVAGLAMAHERGLSHRDIKPDNIWLEKDTGRVKILDFGLARAADDTTNLTQSGAIVGTPSYLSPEQAEGTPCDHRCDVFSLGVVMYEMATGVSPFKRGNLMATLLAVKMDEPKSAAELEPELPQSFAELLSRLMQKDASKRYQSAHDIIAGIDKITAETTTNDQTAVLSAIAGTTRPNRRRRMVAAAGLFGVLSLAAFLVAQQMGVFRIRTPHGYLIVKTDDPNIEVTVKQGNVTVFDSSAKREFELKAGKYQIEVRELKDNKQNGIHLFTKNFVIERKGKRVLDVGLELAKKNTPLPVDGSNPLDNLDPAAIPESERFPWQPKELVAVLGTDRGQHWSGIRDMAVSPDGKSILTLTKNGVYSWDAVTLKLKNFLKVYEPGVTVEATCFALSADGRKLVVNNRLYKLTNSAFQHVTELQGERVDRAVAFAPDGKLLATGSQDTIFIWDLTGPEPKNKAILKGHSGMVSSLAFSPDSKTLASVSSKDIVVRLWDLSGKESREKAVCKGHEDRIFAVAFSPDGKLVASGSQDTTVRLWDLSGRELKKMIPFTKGKPRHVSDIAFSPDGRFMAISNRIAGDFHSMYRLCLLDLSNPRMEKKTFFDYRFGSVLRIAFSPDSRTLFSDSGISLRAWDITGQTAKQILGNKDQSAGIAQVAFSKDGRTLTTVAGGANQTVRQWELADPRPKLKAEHHRLAEGIHPRPVLSSDGRWLVRFVTGGPPKGGIKLLDLTKSSPPPLHVQVPEDFLKARRFSVSPNGTVAVANETSIQIFASSGKERLKIEGDGKELITALAFSPDGQKLAVARWKDADKTAIFRLWNVTGKKPTQEQTMTAPRTNRECTLLIFSHDGNKIAANLHGPVFESDLTKAEPEIIQLPLPSHRPGNYKSMMTYAKNNQTLIVAGTDGKILEVQGSSVRQIANLFGPVNDLAISPDGRYLATANNNGTAYILRLASPPKK